GGTSRRDDRSTTMPTDPVTAPGTQVFPDDHAKVRLLLEDDSVACIMATQGGDLGGASTAHVHLQTTRLLAALHAVPATGESDDEDRTLAESREIPEDVETFQAAHMAAGGVVLTAQRI